MSSSLRSNCRVPSPHSVGQSGLDRRTGVRRTERDNRGDRGSSELVRNIRGDTGEAQHMDAQRLSRRTHRFKIFTAVVPQTELQSVRFEKKVVLYQQNEMNQQYDVTQIDVVEIDRDLLCVTGLYPS
jgi:hypothetical protein